MASKKNLPAKPLPTAEDIEAGPIAADDMRRLLEAAQNGDDAAVPGVRALLKRAPNLHPIHMTRQAQGTMLRTMFGKDLLAQEAARISLRAMRERLEGPNPTELEKVLVARIVTCHIAVNHAELVFSQNLDTCTLAAAEYLDRRIDRAQRRYLAAVDALARVRKMQLPDVNIQNPAQVNIGQQQVNVAAPEGETPPRA